MTETVTYVETTLDIDYDAPIPCEHPNHLNPAHALYHEGPGAVLVRHLACKNCGFTRGLLILCRKAWDQAFIFGLRCSNCGQYKPREECWKLIEVL